MKRLLMVLMAAIALSGCLTQKHVRIREERARLAGCEERDQTIRAYRNRLELFNQVNPDGSLRTR